MIVTQSDHVSSTGSMKKALPWHLLALGAILLIAGFLNFFQLGQYGFPNLYYAAAVKSMLTNIQNFFFVSFDPGGFVTVDKPPLGFWLQTISALLLGFSPFSVLLPQALAGVLSVAVLYRLVARIFGPIAGLLAALALALTPINIVTNRNNTIDSLLVLTVLLAALAVSYAAENGRLRWLLIGALLVGIGFNIKMLQAYLVVPALGALYLLGAPLRWRKRVLHLLLAGVILCVVSFAWVVTVDMIPAAQRPYVGSSGTNSELDLALGYNGLSRLLGLRFAFADGQGGRNGQSGQPPAPSVQGQTQPGSFPGGGPGGAMENGDPGLFRLFNQQLASQVSWLLPLALCALLVLPVLSFLLREDLLVRIRQPLNRQQQALLLWGVWLLTMAIFFSIAGFYHTYYLVMLSPAICALAAVGVVVFWQEYQRVDWRGWLLPLSFLVTAGVQARILLDEPLFAFPSLGFAFTAVIVGLCLLATLTLAAVRIARMVRQHGSSAVEVPGEQSLATVSNEGRRGIPSLSLVAIAGVLTLLIAPAIWGGFSLAQDNGGMLPVAGPRQAGGFVRRGNVPAPDAGLLPPGQVPPGAFPGSGTNVPSVNGAFQARLGGAQHADPKLLHYLEANRGKTKYLLVTNNAQSAAPFILDTGQPVMALNGFGMDTILTAQQVNSLVDNGTVRFFLLQGIPQSSQGGQAPRGVFGGFGAASAGIESWVSAHCSVVPSALWQDSNTGQGFTGPFGGGQLYDCADYHS